MKGLKVAAWVYFGLAGVNVVGFFGTELSIFIAGAISLATVGLLLLGLERVIEILADIRAALQGRPAADPAPVEEAAGAQTSTRTLASLSSDISRLKEKARGG